jgi:hypothetical protein
VRRERGPDASSSTCGTWAGSRNTLILAAGTRITIPPDLLAEDIPIGASLRVTVTRSERGEWIARRIEHEPRRNGRGELREETMADVMCPLSFEDLDALLADEQLPSELAAVFEDSARTIELTGGYEIELTEAEARALLAYAKSHEMRRLESDLRQELADFDRRKREGDQKP